MTASAYVQARDKLFLPVFKDLLSDYNQSAPQKLLNGKYRLYAIDGSDFTTPWNSKSAFIVDANKRIHGHPRQAFDGSRQRVGRGLTKLI